MNIKVILAQYQKNLYLFKNKRKYIKLFHDLFIQKTTETRLEAKTSI